MKSKLLQFLLILFFIIKLNIITLFIIFLNLKHFLFLQIINLYINNKIEIEKIENQLKFYNRIESIKIKVFKKIKNPKISIISPIYNTKSYLIRFLKSIQFQSYRDIELILIDDCSIENPIEIIKDYIEKDKRIKIIKNKKRKGTFLARNLGVLYSKGKYVIIPDPDDIISKNILSICYKYSEKFKYDIIKFNVQRKEGIIKSNKQIYEPKYTKQPELSTTLFYLNNELEQRDFYIWNKLIRKETYIISLNSLNKLYLNIYMTLFEDQIINYILHRFAKSLYYLKNIGYYYLQNSMSITKRQIRPNKFPSLCKFIYLKFIFEYSKNTKYEKDIANLIITFLLNNLKSKFDNINYNFFCNIINIYQNSKFISYNNKYILLNIKKELLKKK